MTDSSGTSKRRLTRYTPHLNGAAYCGMLRETHNAPNSYGPHHDDTGGPWVLASEADAEIERLTKELTIQKGVVDLAYIPHRNLVEQADRERARVTMLRAGLSRIGDLSLSFKPLVDRLLRYQPMDGELDSESPAETGLKP